MVQFDVVILSHLIQDNSET